MENFTRTVNDCGEPDERNSMSRDGHHDDNHDLKSKSYDDDDVDIEALLNRPRFSGYRRNKAFEEAPEFVRRLDAFLEVEAGCPVVFECKWKAFPKPSIKWYRDDEEITPDHPYYRTHEDENHGVANLIIPDAMGSDEGAFKCKAENQEGVASTTGYLSVTGDCSNKTLSAQQKKNSSNNSSSPGSPGISMAPHLMTILEQKSLEEREAEVQRKLPPSPLQDYIEIVQKSKTWPLSRMGYNPEDFVNKHADSEDNEDAQSSGSDTSVDSQPENQVTISVSTLERQQVTIKEPASQSNNTTVQKSQELTNNTSPTSHTNSNTNSGSKNFLHPEVSDVNDNDSVHSFDSTEDDEHVQEPPKCTVSVQIRSCDSVSRLTKIRQAESHRLSLTLSEENSDLSENEVEKHDEEEMTPVGTVVMDTDEKTPIVGLDVQKVNGFAGDAEELIFPDDVQRVSSSVVTANGIERPCNDKRKSMKEQCFESGDTSQIMSNRDATYINDAEVAAEQTCNHILATKQTDDDGFPELTPPSQIQKLLPKIPNNANNKSVLRQSSKERKAKFKKQRSLVEMSLEWIFQKLTGQVGEQLELPWVYYFAFTVLCACFAAAISLNPVYMIALVATMSFVSFRFLPREGDDSNLDSEEKQEVG